jgi:ribonucleotide reductase class II
MSTEFQATAPSAPAVFYRTYSRRKEDGSRESFKEAMARTINDIAKVGKYTLDEKTLVERQAQAQHAFPSGRAFWVAGSAWSQKQENFSGFYNCTSLDISDLQAFGLLMDLAMQGSGTGAVLEHTSINNLPPVRNKIKILPGIKKPRGAGGNPVTNVIDNGDYCTLQVGDSRQGWVDAYQGIINAAFSEVKFEDDTVRVKLDLSQVRASGERLKGFGGTANPVRLGTMFKKVAALLTKAYGRKLTTVEACLLIDEAAACVVAGNIRRSAGMRQFSSTDTAAATAKLGLYTQDKQGNWKVDPEKEALRMANHTICYHTKPSFEEVKESVTKQFYSGEGAIQYVPEALARANADLLDTQSKRDHFMAKYTVLGKDAAADYLMQLSGNLLEERELAHRMTRYGLNPCGEILGRDFHCNLAEVHLNTLRHDDQDALYDAFYAAGLQVAALLQHEFIHERYQYSRKIDPIVGVSFTGLFDFFVHALGVSWLEWMMADRPMDEQGQKFAKLEANYLQFFREAAHAGVKNYCTAHNLRLPNRITTVQPAGTKSLLTGASSGWHPPKAQRFIRRITFGVSDPLVAALRDWGYTVIPAQSARDDEGNLLDDINDPRVQEVLVEIPTEVSWANLPGADKIDLSQLSATAQFGLYHQVQTYYTDHNTSATIEFREHEIDDLAELIWTHMGKGYISAALLARFDANATFPRLPFEPINKDTYKRLQLAVEAHRLPQDEELGFLGVLAKYDNANYELTSETACTSAACVAKAEKDELEGKA